MLFKKPDHKYSSYEDDLNFGLVWNLSRLAVLVTIFLSFCFYFFDKTLFILALISGGISICFLSALKTNTNYKFVAFAYSFTTSLFFCLVMLFVLDAFHLVEYIWMFVVIIYCYAICGKKLGNIILTLNVISITLHIWLVLETNIHNLSGTLTVFHLISTIVTVVFGFLSFGYIVNKQAEIKANIESKLIEKNNLIVAQNKEKAVLLKEVHHRVKNNLQIIISLLRIQYNRNDSKKLQVILETNVKRINSIAMVHEKMYQSKNLASIDYEEYLNSLVTDIIGSFNLSAEVNYSVTSNLENIGNRTVVPLALIFNELITNSVKHAFKDVVQPRIDICLNRINHSKFDLIYKDNGTWENVIDNYNSLGLELIDIFTDQLEGQMTRTCVDNETKYHFNLEIID